jgi:hypothetical protein
MTRGRLYEEKTNANRPPTSQKGRMNANLFDGIQLV